MTRLIDLPAPPPAKSDLAHAIRSDIELLSAVREDRAFAVELASAIVGVQFVNVDRRGQIVDDAGSWHCTEIEAARLIAEMRGLGEQPEQFMAEIRPHLLLTNTGTVAEDHINRLGWRVW